MNYTLTHINVIPNKLEGHESLRVYIDKVLLDEFNISARIPLMSSDEYVDISPDYMKDIPSRIARKLTIEVYDLKCLSAMSFIQTYYKSFEPKRIFNEVLCELTDKNFLYERI